MSAEEGPKLFTSKPKKSKLKASTPSTMASGSSTGPAATAPPPPPPPPPPPTQKQSFIQRYRFLWPLVLGVNFIIGAYVLMRTTKKDDGTSKVESSDTPTGSPSMVAAINEKPVAPPILEPIPQTPIREDQQRELFKWILEEKRKVKPRDAEEKRRIDEEKAILKQFIRAKSIPPL